MTSNLNESNTEMDDESDSCFAYKKPQLFHINNNKRLDESDNCAFLNNNNNNSKSSLLLKTVEAVSLIPPIIKQKSNVPSIVSIKPTTTNHQNNNNNTLLIIDKIANNLKNKLSPEIKLNDQSIPKVSLVNKVNLKPSVNKSKSLSLLDDQSLNKAYAHKLILRKLSQIESESNKILDEEESNDGLTNLSWLTTFNLSTYMNSSCNLLLLSPPKSPSSSPSSPNSLSSSSHSQKSSLNSTIREDYEDDEADSNAHRRDTKHQISTTTTTNHNQMISNLFKKNESHRPSYSFSCLIFIAIESSERKWLSVKEIYSWISQTFLYYHNVPSGSWKNSIRHNLSLNKSFCKVDKNLLAMRDFSGKGSLWCIDPKIRSDLLDIFKKCTISNNLDELAKNVNLKDINEMPFKHQQQQQHQQIRANSSDSRKNFSKSKVSPGEQHQQQQQQPTKAILNPKLVARLANAHQNTIKSVNLPKITSVVTGNKSNSFLKSNSFNSRNVSSAPIVVNNRSSEVNSEMDAVKALLSMKSKATSMPTVLANETKINEENNTSFSKNRRKQMFKQPIKKSFKYDEDNEDDDNDEDDYFIEEEDQEINESCSTNEEDDYEISDLDDSNLNNITNEDDDENDKKLEIDESNPLLELSRAAVLVENDEPIKKKLKTEIISTNSNSILTKSVLSKTMTRSRTKLNEKK